MPAATDSTLGFSKLTGIRKKASWEIRSHIDHASRAHWLAALNPGASILDVGCGNRSASLIRNYRKDLHICGIDVQDYAITLADKALMEDYLISVPGEFARGILSFKREFEMVLSAHNLEHCDHPADVLEAMCSVVRSEGLLYLAFPSEASVHLPSRDGCLNFYDDPTHHNVPQFDAIMKTVAARNFEILGAVRRNRGNGGLGWILGAMQEPWSYLSGKVRSYTWNFWGFESVIVARRRKTH